MNLLMLLARVDIPTVNLDNYCWMATRNELAFWGPPALFPPFVVPGDRFILFEVQSVCVSLVDSLFPFWVCWVPLPGVTLGLVLDKVPVGYLPRCMEIASFSPRSGVYASLREVPYSPV